MGRSANTSHEAALGHSGLYHRSHSGRTGSPMPTIQLYYVEANK